MFLIDRLILLAAVLLLAGIVSSKFSARMGLPVLVLFLGIGMLAGEDGIGGIEFDNVNIAHAIGTLSLAVILYDGGLQTRSVALVSRNGSLIAPRGSTQLRAGDHPFVIARTSDRGAVNRVLGHDEA